MAYKQFTGGERYPSWNSSKENPAFKKGSVIEGFYVSKKQVTTAAGASMLYALKTDNGMMGVWGTKILDDFFGAMKDGVKVKLTYQGLLSPKKGGRPYHGYQCDYDEDVNLVQDAVDETFGA